MPVRLPVVGFQVDVGGFQVDVGGFDVDPALGEVPDQPVRDPHHLPDRPFPGLRAGAAGGEADPDPAGDRILEPGVVPLRRRHPDRIQGAAVQ